MLWAKTIDVEMTNRVAHLTSHYYGKELQKYWSFAHPKWKFVQRSRPGWDGMIRFLKYDKLPAGLFWATYKEIEDDLGIKFKIRGALKRAEIVDRGIRAEGKYEFQNECVEKMLKTVRFGGGLILNATGTGKTYMAGQFFSRLKNMAVFVVDQLVLLEQAREDIEGVLKEEVGWIGDSEFQPRRITVATRQTLFLHKEDERFKVWEKGLNVVVVDEIHEQMNHSNFSVVQDIKPKAVFGLTATLAIKKKSVRLKAFALCGPVVYEYPLVRGQREGVLSQGVCVRVVYPNPITKSEKKVLGWNRCYDEKIVWNNERNFIIEDITRQAYQQEKYIIVLVTRIQHLELLSKRLQEIPHRIVSGTFDGKGIKVEERILSKNSFESGQVRVILANTVFKKGVDIKRVDCIIDGAAGRNENDPIQKFGRGIRLHDEKSGLIYFDINDEDQLDSDNWFEKASRYRIRSLKRAGVEVGKFIWSQDGEGKELIEFGARLLKKKLKL